jgi:hypothetical protein
MGDFVNVHTIRRVVIEFLTMAGSSPGHLRSVCGEDTINVNSDAGFVVLRSMKRTLATGLAAVDSHGSEDEDQKQG